MILSSENKLHQRLFYSWAIAVIAVSGSLYFSEIKQYEPCELCWYQRIFMYPLVVLLGIAYVKKHLAISFYAMVISALGGDFTLSFSIQKFPFMAKSDIFCGRIPCNGQYINWFGFITIHFSFNCFYHYFYYQLFHLESCKGGEIILKRSYFLGIVITLFTAIGILTNYQNQAKIKDNPYKNKLIPKPSPNWTIELPEHYFAGNIGKSIKKRRNTNCVFLQPLVQLL